MSATGEAGAAVVQSIDDVRRRADRAGPAPQPRGRGVPARRHAALHATRSPPRSRRTSTSPTSTSPRTATSTRPIQSLYGQGEPVDPVTVAEELRRADLLDVARRPAALLRIQAATPASANAGHYAEHRLRARAAAPADRRRGRHRRDGLRRTRRRRRRRSTAPRRWSSRSPSAASPTRWSASPTRSRTRSTSSRRSTATTATSPACPPATPRSTPSCSACSRRTWSIVAARPGMGKTSLALGLAAQRRARRPASRSCSSRWRWARSSSPSACWPMEARVDATRAPDRRTSPRPTGRDSATRSAGSPRRRSSSTTTRTAR